MLDEESEEIVLFFCWRKKQSREYWINWMSKWKGKLKEKSVVHACGVHVGKLQISSLKIVNLFSINKSLFFTLHN